MIENRPLTLTVEQAAAVLGIARSTAYEAVRSGDIESIRIRRRIVVSAGWLAERLGASLPEVLRAAESTAMTIKWVRRSRSDCQRPRDKAVP